MRSFELDFFPRAETRGDEYGQFDDTLESFLNSLSKNGNIVGQWQILELPECVQVRVLAPEDIALDEQYWNIYARENYAKIIALAERPAEFRCIAEKMGKREEQPYCTCESPSAYILFTTFLALKMPVDCFDCRCSVPLYRLPYLCNEKEHYALSNWQSTYAALDWLFMGSGVGERYAYQQLNNPRSTFNKESRQLAKELEAKTGTPVYTFLLHHYERFGDECPLCKRLWRLKEKQGLFRFKCDHCRLLSQEAPAEPTPLSELHP